MTKNRPAAGPEDVALGERIRSRRLQIGMTQERLGEQLGVSFQQIQKYEKGSNRVATGRLRQIAGALQVHTTDLMGPEPTSVVEALDVDAVRVARAITAMPEGESRRALVRIALDLAATTAAAA